MARIPEPGGYEREAGSAFGVAPPMPATGLRVAHCTCCEEAFETAKVKPKRCAPCRARCHYLRPCTVPKKGGE